MELAMGGLWQMINRVTKRIKVSDKRQITIPIQFFKDLNIGGEVECTIDQGALIIRPVPTEDDGFATEILKNLVSNGYTGDELVEKFESIQKQIRPAIKRMIAHADETARRIAADPNYNSEAVLHELFGDLEDE